MANSKKVKHKKGKRSIGRKIKLGLQIMLFLTLLSITVGIFYFYHLYGKTILQLQSDAREMVSESTEDTFKASQTSLVYDEDGNLISTLKSEKDVYYIEYEQIPTLAIDAMVVTEDRKFFEHDGVDYLANVRAAIELIKNRGEIKQGASTITQQLARGTFLTMDVTYKRKIAEIFVAQELEKKYTKDQIMEFYMNGINFSNGHYGLQAAAQAYFSKGVSSLSLSEIAFLCAIPNNPTLYNPLTKIDNTLKRRDRILTQLFENGKIEEEDYQAALDEKIVLHPLKTEKKNYVETYVYYSAIRALMKEQGFSFRNQFENEEDETAYDEAYDDLYYSCQKKLYTQGYRIYTSIDLEKQQLLQESVDDALDSFTDVNEEGVYQMQGAAVCIDNDTGRVVAIVGGRDQDLNGYTLNRGYQSYRQPGSSIKPLIVYAPSFERDYTPNSIVVDEKIEDGPKNSDGTYLGKIKLQKAIEKSKNTIAWKLFQELTPQTGLSYLLAMNFSKIKDSDYTLASALGGLTVGVSPVEMAAAYSALENDGYYREPTCILKIMDSEGNEIVGDTVKTKKIYETNAARIMTEALTGVIKNGTGKGLGLTNTISAGKTGTTNDKKDGWFVGYTPYYTTSVWVGYDMPKSVSDLTGASYPGTIWHNFMEQLHTPSMKEEFEYYDWRAVLKAKEEEEEKKEQEDAFKEEPLEEDTSPDDTKETENPEDTGSDSAEDQDNTDNTEDNSDNTTDDDSETGDDTGENPEEDTGNETGDEENEDGTSPEEGTQNNQNPEEGTGDTVTGGENPAP
jgi:penicillin-binding protein 4